MKKQRQFRSRQGRSDKQYSSSAKVFLIATIALTTILILI